MSKSKKVIVVDDSPAILDSVESLMLDMEGFEVSNYERGTDMFNSLLETSTKPDIILMDMWLSGEDGRDICKMIKAHQEFSKHSGCDNVRQPWFGRFSNRKWCNRFYPKTFRPGRNCRKNKILLQ